VALPPSQHPEMLAALEYPLELAIKQEALARTWSDQELPGTPDEIVPAPRPRGYRTTTKRRALTRPEGIVLGFPGLARGRRGPESSGGTGDSVGSALDLPEHLPVYALLERWLREPGGRPLAETLSWAIVRGTAGALTVVLNVRVFNARVVRAAARLAEELQRAPLGVRAGFLFLDPTGSEYYLEARRPEGRLTLKRLFGPGWLEARVGELRLRFPPTVFSQVNGFMLGEMTSCVGALVGPLEGLGLLDLYCGYGLLALTIGRSAEQVIGIEIEAAAIEAARANAAFLGCSEHVRFRVGRIDGELLANQLHPSPRPEVVVLDPPRQGTVSSVIPALAERGPVRVVHICCGIDEIAREVGAWAAAGFELRRILPLDLFAGTAGLETLLLLEPGAPPQSVTRPDHRPGHRPDHRPVTRGRPGRSRPARGSGRKRRGA